METALRVKEPVAEPKGASEGVFTALAVPPAPPSASAVPVGKGVAVVVGERLGEVEPVWQPLALGLLLREGVPVAVEV